MMLITINENGVETSREMTKEEQEKLIAVQSDATRYEKERQNAEKQTTAAKAAAQAKLVALGLTTDDLKALGLGGN